jgi:hypothetical protein
MEIAGNSRFERIDDSLASGTSLLLHREGTNSEAPVGDFLSRIWNLYGKPNVISFEGFEYTFKDVETGFIFTAYCAGSGPAFGGDQENETRLLSIIKKFDELLNQSGNIDCEVSIPNDFGMLICGAKNGVPFDTLIED